MTEAELFTYIKKLIDAGKTGTSELAVDLGKDVRTTRRYLVKMAELKIISLDAESGRVVKTTLQQEMDKLEAINLDEFAQNEVIKKWIGDCEGRVKAETLQGYISNLKAIFKRLPINPKYIVSSKANALEYWKNYQKQYKLDTGKSNVSQSHRITFRNLLDSYDISFGHKMGKKHGLGSEHDAYKKYAGVSIAKFVNRLCDAMIANKDYDLHLWFKCGLRTSARASALASMSWDRIYFDNTDENNQPHFKIELHETKIEKGHYHLGKDGNWFDYYPNPELKTLLQEWKIAHPEFRRFVWFEDTGADTTNKKKARWIQDQMPERLSKYYDIIRPELDPLTNEYLTKRPDHMMCHTFAQMCKNEGMSDEEIAEAGHWTDAQSVSWYCKIQEGKKKELAKRIAGMSF